jgi:flagellar biosynthesis/type III secretory pathway chaperone
VDDHLNSLKEIILAEQELLHDAKTKCFAEVQKMVDMLKALENYLEVSSQIIRTIECLQTKIEELEEWRNLENNVPNGLPVLKLYDIRLHTLDTHEC